MKSNSSLQDDDNEKKQSSFKVNIPRTNPKYLTKDALIKQAKCQLYQWIEVQKIPSPHRARIYTETIKRQYPLLQFNEELYNEWSEEICTLYRSKYELSNDNTETSESKQEISNPDWLLLQVGNIDNLILKKYNINKLSLEDRCIGILLSVFSIDALGAPFEGWPYENIIENCNKCGIINMIPGTHMGARAKGPRCGYYTDDTMTTMALGLSIVENQKLLAQPAAENYFKFWATNPIYRGLHDSAQKALNDVIEGMSITITGRQSFNDGSYANGGAMRISSVGISYRNASYKVLKDAVIDAIISSHCHPQSIDGSLCIALMIQYALQCDGNNKIFNSKELIDIILNNMETEEMKAMIQNVSKGYNQVIIGYNQIDIDMNKILNDDIEFLNQNKLLTFQIRAIEAIPLVLYCILRWHNNPEQCAINVVTLGGDCDTTGSMVGGILGALHGTSWIPNRWYENLENTWKGDNHFGAVDKENKYSICTNAYGLDLAEYLGLQLSKLNFTQHEKFVDTKKNKGSDGIMSKIKNLFPGK